MQEVTVELKFVTPSLGGVRCSDYDKFERDHNGNVIFMSSWWRELLRYGGQALGKHQELVLQVRFNPKIEGEVKRYKRYYAAAEFKEHEAFLKGDSIIVKAMLPTGLPVEDFSKIMKLAGLYRGISPYKYCDGWGNFDVVSVSPIS
jgi:hypothetical protein